MHARWQEQCAEALALVLFFFDAPAMATTAQGTELVAPSYLLAWACAESQVLVESTNLTVLNRSKI